MLFKSSPCKLALCALVAGVVSSLVTNTAHAQFGASEQLVRVAWQDAQDRSLHWGEFVQVGPSIVFQDQGKISSFPALNNSQMLGTMQRIDNMLVVGVRGGGWVAVDLQVTEQPHGDHSDYTYGDSPRVTLSMLSDPGKYPIHLYDYNNEFYLANDPMNGFTRINPSKLMVGGDEALGEFYQGGGGHITLAAVDKKVAYSTWIKPSESGGGRVDVVNLATPGSASIAYSFESPTPGLHGAITKSGKVFMAPSDGIIWVEADVDLSKSPEEVKVNHISLGKTPMTTNPTEPERSPVTRTT
jgi:hypothetical protein